MFSYSQKHVSSLSLSLSVCLFKAQTQKHLISRPLLSSSLRQQHCAGLEEQAIGSAIFTVPLSALEIRWWRKTGAWSVRCPFLKSPDALFDTLTVPARPQPVWVFTATLLLPISSAPNKCQLAWLVSQRDLMQYNPPFRQLHTFTLAVDYLGLFSKCFICWSR